MSAGSQPPTTRILSLNHGYLMACLTMLSCCRLDDARRDIEAKPQCYTVA
jgi:hypothetical protein